MKKGNKKILIIAPHPDDEVLGCGGYIKRCSSAGYAVYLCIVTEAYTPDWTEKFIENRKNEIARANDVLGIKKTVFLGLPTAKLDTLPQKKINDILTKKVFEIDPDAIFIPFSADLNKDHRIIFEASLVAARPYNRNRPSQVFCYEVLSETEWGNPLANEKKDIFVPNVYADIGQTLKDKIRAMSCYASEVKRYPHPRSLDAIKILAKKRGSEAGFKAAEAFMAIREIL